MEMRVKVTGELFSDKVSVLERLQERLSHRIENTLGLRVAVRLVEPHTIERSQGKAKRVIDQREAADG
jgi:phenylacetate-CoA ligase